MELTAVIKALQALKEPTTMVVHSDSKYVIDGASKWILAWRKNGWRTREKEPVKNDDLWRALDAEASRHDVTWEWVKGHAGNPKNERCDRLANAQSGQVHQLHQPMWARRH